MYYLGIDLGGTNIAIGIVDEDYKIVKKGSTPTLSERDLEEVVKDIASLSMKLLDEANIDVSEIAHAGIGSPGSIDPVNGVVISSNNIRMYNYPIVDVLKKYLPIENIYTDNDANAAALGEAMGGAAKGTPKNAVTGASALPRSAPCSHTTMLFSNMVHSSFSFEDIIRDWPQERNGRIGTSGFAEIT